jgi:predicted GH43/DUF377 family glycosyl hydrolase
MTTCSVSPERHSTTLYSSDNGLDFRFEDIVLDHQNKDMLIFEGLIDGKYWAQTRPLGDLYFTYPPGSEWRGGPSINLATSPDALHWKPHREPGIRPHAATIATARIGGGTPPILTDEGWLTLWHGVEPKEIVGIYRTYWSILDRDDPAKVLRTVHEPLLEAAPDLTRPLEDKMYVRDVVFTTGIADAGDHYVVASGEADLACRITHIPKTSFAGPPDVSWPRGPDPRGLAHLRPLAMFRCAVTIGISLVAKSRSACGTSLLPAFAFSASSVFWCASIWAAA